MKHQKLFESASVWRAIATMAAPAVLSILIMILYNMADMFFVAQMGDTAQVAAVSVVGPIFSLLMALGSMIGGGGCAMIARTLGSGDTEKARTFSSLCCWGAFGFGILFSLLVLPFLDPVLRFLGADAAMWDYAKTYLFVLALGAPFILFSNALGNVVRAEGAVKEGMLGGLIGTVSNIILDPIFIMGFQMGVGGAAIATVLSNVLGCIYFIWYLRGKRTTMTMHPRYAIQKPLQIFPIMALGLPNACSTLLAGFAGTFSNQILVGYGTNAVAAMAAAGKSVMVISMVQMGICMGVQPLMAYTYGAKNLPRLREIVRKLTILTFALGTVATALCFVWKTPLVGLFIKQPEVAALGERMMTLSMIAGPFLGFYYISSNFLQASGKAFVATVVSILRQGILLIPLLYVMNAVFAVEGIAWAHVAADTGATVIAVLAMLWQYRALRTESLGEVGHALS